MTGPAREPVPVRGEAGMQEGVAGCREKRSVVCRASAAQVNTATAGYAAAFDAAASAACVACAAFAFAAAAASVGAGAAAAAAACGAAEAAAAGDAGNAAAAFAAESAGGAFAAAAFDGAASAAASAAAWKHAGAASADSIATIRLTADRPLPSAPAAATERRRPSCSDELPWQSGCCRHAFAEVLGLWLEAGPAGAPVPRRTSRGAGIEGKGARALVTGWWRRGSAAPSGSSGPPLTLRQPETEIASGQMNSSTQQILSYVAPSPLLVLIW